MIDGEEQALLGEVREQANQILAAAINFRVLAFGYVIDADVGLGAARHRAGYFFADKKIGMAAQLFRAADRIVIGQRDQVHAAFAQHGVNVSRSTVALQKKMPQEGHRQGP